MTPFSESTLATAQRYLDNAIALLEEHADMDASTRDPTLLGQAYGQLLRVRGVLAAVAQLEQLAADIGKADTERPCPMAMRCVAGAPTCATCRPALRLVK